MTLPSVAPAQEDIVFSMDATEACLTSADTLLAAEACIGMAAVSCMQDSAGGTSKFGQDACLDAELFVWDQRLVSAEARVLAKAEAEDTANDASANGLLSRAEALRTTTQAWMAFRDASCDYAMAKYNGGSGTSAANLRCLLDLTGRRALWFAYEEKAY